MHEDIPWNAITWAIIAGCGWIAKQILKPWSDAALAFVAAFKTHIQAIGTNLDTVTNNHAIQTNEQQMQTELLKSQTQLLEKIETCSQKTEASNAEIVRRFQKWPSDAVEVCQAKMIASVIEKAIEAAAEKAAAKINTAAESTAVKL